MIIDALLRDQYSINAARKIAKLADSCLNKNARDRPTMNQVVEILKQAIQDSQKGTNSVNNNFGASGSKLGKKTPS
ncbi:putative non-specific serine/threonine protein kinase [Rosa chinensis]|uniref:Putative non-specific serine/threonine protein kinase n=1 Tax=Rosa chinensis TaxID=74649 RepID=A0A2P6SQI3_ROSCH|nr:putative non-specific serine/threonine protein kinase [Rosa chinensis]